MGSGHQAHADRCEQKHHERPKSYLPSPAQCMPTTALSWTVIRFAIKCPMEAWHMMACIDSAEFKGLKLAQTSPGKQDKIPWLLS